MPISASDFGDIAARAWALLKFLVITPLMLLAVALDIVRNVLMLWEFYVITIILWAGAMGLMAAQPAVMTGASAVYEKVIYPVLDLMMDLVILPLKAIFIMFRPIWNLYFEFVWLGRNVLLTFVYEFLSDPRTIQLLEDMMDLLTFVFGIALSSTKPGIIPADIAEDLAEWLVDLFFLAVDLFLLLIKFATLVVGAPDVFYPGVPDPWDVWSGSLGQWFVDFWDALAAMVFDIMWYILEQVLQFMFDLWDLIVSVVLCVINLGDCICNPGNYFDGATRPSFFDIICPADLNPSSGAISFGTNTALPASVFFTWANSIVNHQVPIPVGVNATCELLNRVPFGEHVKLPPLEQLSYAGCATFYYTGLALANISTNGETYDPDKLAVVPMTANDALGILQEVTRAGAHATFEALRNLAGYQMSISNDLRGLQAYLVKNNLTLDDDGPKTRSQAMIAKIADLIEEKFNAKATVYPLAHRILATLGTRLSLQLKSSYSPRAIAEFKVRQWKVTNDLGHKLSIFGQAMVNGTRILDRLRLHVATLRPDLGSQYSIDPADGKPLLPLSRLPQLTPLNLTSDFAERQDLMWAAFTAATAKGGEMVTHFRERLQEYVRKDSNSTFLSTLALAQASKAPQKLIPATRSIEPRSILPPVPNTDKEDLNIQVAVESAIEAIVGLFIPNYEFNMGNATGTLFSRIFGLNEDHQLCVDPAMPSGYSYCWWPWQDGAEQLGLFYYMRWSLAACEKNGPTSYMLDPHPDYGYTWYSFQCFPRYRTDTWDWIAPFPTWLFNERLYFFYDLCTYTPAPGDLCTDYRYCHRDLGFYDGIDNMVFFLEAISNGTITNWARDSAFMKSLLNSIGLLPLIDTPLENFDFQGQKVRAGYWGCWLYTLPQVGLLWPFFWILFLLLRYGIPFVWGTIILFYPIIARNPVLTTKKKLDNDVELLKEAINGNEVAMRKLREQSMRRAMKTSGGIVGTGTGKCVRGQLYQPLATEDLDQEYYYPSRQTERSPQAIRRGRRRSWTAAGFRTGSSFVIDRVKQE